MKLSHLTLLALLATFSTACFFMAPTPPPPPPTPDPTPTLPPLARSVEVQEDAIVIMSAIDPPSFNAYLNDSGYEALVGELVYGALAEIGPDGNYYPELARELPTLGNGGLSPDGRTVTWRLRPNLQWSDGVPLTSADIRFTWQALQDSGIWAPGFNLIEEIETPDALTAIIRYRAFYPNYLRQFGGLGTGVLPAHHCGEPAEMLFWDCNFEPISSGPYVLAEWLPGNRLAFVKNPFYYQPDLPLTEQIILDIQIDAELRVKILERDGAHLDLWPAGPELRLMERNQRGILIQRTDPARYVLRLVANLDDPTRPGQPHPMLSNPQVRRAIRQAIDAQEINRTAFLGRGRAVPTELFQFGCVLPPRFYDPGIASSLLTQAGWRYDEAEQLRYCDGCGTAPDGTPFILTGYTYEEYGEPMELAFNMVDQMLGEVGIRLNTEVVEGAQLWGTWADEGIELRGEFDLNLWDDGYYGVDPTLYLADYFDPRAIPSRENPLAGLNVSRYSNPKVLDIFDALYTPLPNTRRRILLCELATILNEDLPHIPLLTLPDVYAKNDRLQGVQPHIYDTITWNAQDWRLVR